MTYKLKKFKEVHGIDVYVDPETKTQDRDQPNPLWFGGFHVDPGGELQFHQCAEYLFDLEDIKLLAHIAEKIEGNGFETIYNEAE
jgi:hypothetical protein